MNTAGTLHEKHAHPRDLLGQAGFFSWELNWGPIYALIGRVSIPHHYYGQHMSDPNITVRQGQPNVKALHDQPTAIDLGASSRGVAGVVVDIGARHTVAAASSDDEGRKLAYPEAYNAADRIMDLDFYKNFKDRYNDLSKRALTTGGTKFYSLVLGFQWEEKMIKYVREERLNPHDKICTGAKRILGVMNMDDICYRAVEILIEEGKIKVYDCNLPALDEADFFTHMQPLLEFFPILLRQSELMDNLPVKV
ncbi:hypothetical protein FXO38_31519 [Capsicum annuum]|nr:hypothetical protein FXO38_31519 [Capsicum annuum]